MSALPHQQFLLQHASVPEPVGVATGLLPHTSGSQFMTSTDTTGSQVSESEISMTLDSLRECFETVRRGELRRVRGRLGNLSPDQENAIDSLSHALIEGCCGRQWPCERTRGHAIRLSLFLRRCAESSICERKELGSFPHNCGNNFIRVCGQSHFGVRRWPARSLAVTAIKAP